ncbi:simple sugar transport system permease protein [Aminobacter niigataensis]|uniref:Simple sugar transport system permease protein n=1 Tax=Aminobacter niigataensis TaxID=83265 RepID=A0ABR6L5I4_9HYPH|nr:ABC transporter permease [Aminobacter niigataensis]MBB4652068.1 simple sugar transport system permease protein [Aminobacter niigataensis]
MTDIDHNIPAALPAVNNSELRAKRQGFGRFNLEVRQHASAWYQVVALAGGVGAGLFIAALILVASGVGFSDLANEFIFSIFSTPRSLSDVLTQAAPLLIVGLAAAVAFRVRFWNIGIEGQMILGSIAATGVAIGNIGPAPLRVATMFIAAALGGMLWMLIPALLRIRHGVNEIISTLLLNYVAFNLLLHLLYGSWKDPKSGFPNSEQYEAVERLATVGWESLTYALPLALILTAVIWWLLNVSRYGYFTRVVQANPRMAAAMGLPVIAVTMGAALLSGALAGVAGFAISAGVEYRMTQGFFVGYGFSGILIAFLARNNPLGAVLVALCVATLFIASQSLQVFYQIPGSVVQLVQAVVVICVAASEFFIRYRIRRIHRGS